MRDPRVDGLAGVLVRYSLELQAGQVCLIQGGVAAEPLVQAIYEQVLDAGAHPIVDLAMEGAQAAFFARASDEQLEWIAPPEEWAIENADARIRILSDTNTRELSTSRPSARRVVREPDHPLMQRMMERSAAGELRWNVTLFPTNAYASAASMSLRRLRGLLLPRLPRRSGGPGRRLEAGGGGDQPARRVDPGTRGGADRGPRHRSDAERGRSHLQARRRQVQHAGRGVLHRTARGLGGGRDHLPPAGDLLRPRGVGRPLPLRGRQGRRRNRGARRGLPDQVLDTDEGARRLGELGIGTNFGISRRAPARSCSTRRSAAPSTWRSAPATRRPAASTSRPSTGT